MTNAAEFDELLGQGVPPELRALIIEARNPGLADQVDAAQTESITIMETMEGRPVEAAGYNTVDEWLRLAVIDTLLRWANGRAKTCLHAPDLHHPQPVWSAVWKPGLVVCTDCLHLLNVTGPADKTCDCCGRICAGVDHDDPIYTTTVWLGALACQAGTCGDCRPHATRQ